jgi:nucleoside-diphosphate-sugar epimerase
MSPLTGRRIALVGGAGFIGHHLALALARAGATVSAIDFLRINNLLAYSAPECRAPHRELALCMLRQRQELLRAAGVRLFTQDARDLRALTRLMKQLRPDVAVHLAGMAHADRSNDQPHAAFQHTLLTLENTLDALRGDAEHVIYFSSSMVYGDFPAGSVTEESDCRPVGIYGALKLSAEKLVVAHHQVFGVPYTIVRPSALYGERCVSRRVIQVFLENALRGEPLTVAGDGAERLDFTYIEDLVQGILAVATQPAARNQTFNLTFGRSRSINDLLGILGRHFDDLRVTFTPRHRLTPLRGTLCVDRARERFGYRAAWPLEDGVARYLEWYRSLGRAAVAHPERRPAAVAHVSRGAPVTVRAGGARIAGR